MMQESNQASDHFESTRNEQHQCFGGTLKVGNAEQETPLRIRIFAYISAPIHLTHFYIQAHVSPTEKNTIKQFNWTKLPCAVFDRDM